MMMGLTFVNKMDSAFFTLIFIALIYEGNGFKTLMCISSGLSSAPFEILDQDTYNRYDDPYAPWWSIFKVPCSDHYRSPLLDHWTQLNVTKLKVNVMNTHRQVFYSQEFNVSNNNSISEMIMDPNIYNHSFFMTGMNGMDFLIADSNDSRNLKFGMLPGPDLTKLILDTADEGYFTIPNATGFHDCMFFSNTVPDAYTMTSNVSYQEQCLYDCYRRHDLTALIYSLDAMPGHVCHCYTGILSSNNFGDGDLCGNQCEGDLSQSCGNQTHAVIIQAYDAVHEGLRREESQTTMISVILPMSGEVEVNLTNPSVVNQHGMAFLAKIEVSDEQWPTIKLFHSLTTCDSSTLKTNKFSLSSGNGTKYVNDLMFACVILKNNTELIAPLEVNLTFSPYHVIFPSRFVLEAEFENDVCEYKDVGVVDTVIPDSNIDIWVPISGSGHVSTINHGGVLIGAYKRPFPSPRIMAYRTMDLYSYVSHVTVKTTASNIKIEVTNCGGIFENRTLTRVSQTGMFNYFNATNLVLDETFTCLDLVVIEIDTDSVTSYESYIFVFYIMGCTSTSYSTSTACPSVTELTEVSPGFPYDRIVIHSSSTDIGPSPVKPCEESLFLTRASFAEPMIITVILLNDDRRESLAVNSILVVGDVDSIILQYTPSFSNGSVVTLPSSNITINGDELEADISPIDMYAVRIVDATKGTFHNITDVVIKACVLTAEILAGTYVNDSRLCETTFTTTTAMTSTTSTTSVATTPGPSTTTTTPSTTTLVSTTTMECCSCTSVKPTISIQEAEEKAEQLAKELQVDVSTLSSTIRKKTSAKDERPSAKMVGSIGVILLSLTLGLVIVLDADYIVKVVKMIRKWQRLQQKLKLAEEKSASVDAEGLEKNESNTYQT